MHAVVSVRYDTSSKSAFWSERNCAGYISKSIAQINCSLRKMYVTEIEINTPLHIYSILAFD